MEFIAEQEFAPPVIVYSWDTRWKKAVAGFRPGVVDCLEQPLDVQALKFRLDAACRRSDLSPVIWARPRKCFPRIAFRDFWETASRWRE